jgi:hypothetical protein
MMIFRHGEAIKRSYELMAPPSKTRRQPKSIIFNPSGQGRLAEKPKAFRRARLAG